MNETAKINSKPAGDWRFPLIVGLSVAVAVPASRSVLAQFEPAWGYWGAFAVGVTVAGALGGLIASVAGWVLKMYGGQSK